VILYEIGIIFAKMVERRKGAKDYVHV
jgi:Sec-independent protein secretion pathway component TatC